MSSRRVTNLECIFKQRFNVTPIMYRNIVRINKARQRLLSGPGIDDAADGAEFKGLVHNTICFDLQTFYFVFCVLMQMHMMYNITIKIN